MTVFSCRIVVVGSLKVCNFVTLGFSWPHVVYSPSFSRQLNSVRMMLGRRVATGSDIIHKYLDPNPDFNRYGYSDSDIFGYGYSDSDIFGYGYGYFFDGYGYGYNMEFGTGYG
jgi:hypothetical protein